MANARTWFYSAVRRRCLPWTWFRTTLASGSTTATSTSTWIWGWWLATRSNPNPGNLDLYEYELNGIARRITATGTQHIDRFRRSCSNPRFLRARVAAADCDRAHTR